MDDFREPFGNITLGLSDEHGNEVDLECDIGEPRVLTKINWEQVNQLASNITVSVDLECPVDREKYERLWRLIAYYSDVPAHLQRGILLRSEPNPVYVYRQDSEKDAQYYTGVKVNIMAQPAWLMQISANLQLNRLQSTAKMVKLILSTDFSETVETELVRRQRRTWVTIESRDTTRSAVSAILGNPSQMHCNVHSSGQPVIHWMLPNGSRVEAPYSSPDNRVSLSSDGQLVIKAVRHADTGIYYCIAKVHEDLAVMPFRLTVLESSSPPPGEDTSITPLEGFAGHPMSLPCTASGSPDAEIHWILPNSNIVSFRANSSRALVYSNGTLHIPRTQLLDSGHYKCVAINQHGVDTLATKITLVRRKGLIRPLRRFPTRPQSASGVNTQINVPTEDTEEASGDVEVPQTGAPTSRSDPLRKRFPGGVAPGRRGVHPSRKGWRRPPVLRKPRGPHVEDGKNTVESRRKINMSKSKIDPEKWADILAKIRDRNAQNVATPLPLQHTTERTQTEKATQTQGTIEGSSTGMTVQDYFITPQTPTQYTQMTTTEHPAEGQGTYVISDSDTTHNTRDVTSNSQNTHGVHVAEEPHMTQTPYNAQHTAQDTHFDTHTSSNSVFFPQQQTTSVPLDYVTFWQASTNTPSSSTFPPKENQSTNTDVNGVKAADESNASEISENMDRLNVGASSTKELSSSQMIPSVSPNESESSQMGNGKHLSITATTTQLHTHPKESTLESQAMLTQVSPTTTPVPTMTRRRGSEGRLPPRIRQPHSRRRSGVRRKKPNKRKLKLIKPPQVITTIPSNALLATVTTVAFKQLKIDPLKVKTDHLYTTVPFSGSQAASSSGIRRHAESSVSGHDDPAARKLSSLTTSPPETSGSHQPTAKPQLQRTSPSFPTASPEVGRGKTSSQTALRTSGSPSPPKLSDMITSVTDGPLPPVKPSEEAQQLSATGDLGPMARSGDVLTLMQVLTDVGPTESDYQYTPTEKGEIMQLKETKLPVPLLPPPFASAASLTEHEINTTSGYASSGLITTLSVPPDAEDVTSKIPTLSERPSHDFSQNKATSSESEANTGNHSVTPLTSIAVTTTVPPTSSRPDVVVPHVTRPETFPTETQTGPFFRATTQEAPRINIFPDDHGQDQQTQPITTSEPMGTSDLRPATQSTEHKLAPFISTNPTSPALRLTSKATVTNAPTIAAIQTDPFRGGLPTSTQEVSKKPQLPGRGSLPRGKPRITKSTFQTFTVDAETDAELPCGAEGEPMPFLSWTKVASGMYDSTFEQLSSLCTSGQTCQFLLYKHYGNGKK